MKIWTNTEFEGHYPVGTAAIVIADTQEQASILLNEELPKYGLAPTANPSQFILLGDEKCKPVAVVLLDGDY